MHKLDQFCAHQKNGLQIGTDAKVRFISLGLPRIILVAILIGVAFERLMMALNERFGIRIAVSPLGVDAIVQAFYTSLGTDQELAGFYLPLGVIPGQDTESRINLISLEKFHGVTELYYYLEEGGELTRGPTLLSRTRTDALSLPIVTIPISRLPGA